MILHQSPCMQLLHIISVQMVLTLQGCVMEEAELCITGREVYHGRVAEQNDRCCTWWIRWRQSIIILSDINCLQAENCQKSVFIYITYFITELLVWSHSEVSKGPGNYWKSWSIFNEKNYIRYSVLVPLTWPRCRIFWTTMRTEAGSALWSVVLVFRSLKNCRLWVAQPLQFSVSPVGV